MAIVTSEALLGALEKSRLLEPDLMESARQVARQSAGPADDPRALAKALVQQGLLTRWQAGQVLIERPSFFVGKYKLIDLLGKGGMGRVFLARHTMMNRPVALKMIFQHLGHDPAALERFLAEARAVAALDHPNIVRAYSVDNEGDRYYLVMEYVEGQDLQRIVEKEGPLDFERAADYVRQAADGLAHAHAKGVIHGDVKPANFLINPQGVLRILDLGMARLTGEEKQGDEPAGSGDRLVGSVDYLAPEAANPGAEPDSRGDIYSLGCTFYFLLTGHAPFPEGTLPERILKHQTEAPRSIVEQRPGTPRELARICQKMMAKAPADRYASAEEVGRLLADWRPTSPRIRRAVPLTEEEVRAMEAEGRSDVSSGPAASPWLAWMRRAWNRPWALLVAGAAVVVLSLLAVVAVALLRGPGSRAQESSAEPGSTVPPIAQAEPRSADPGAWPGLTPLSEQPPAKPAASAGPKPPEGQAPKAADSTSAKPAGPVSPKPPASKLPAEKAPTEKAPAGKAPGPPTAPSPAKPAPPADPFRDFPRAVDLPPVAEKGQPGEPRLGASPLAPLYAAPDAPCEVSLLGRETPLKGARRLTLTANGENKPGWIVRMQSSPAKEASQADVARLERTQDALTFQWLDGASTAAAAALRNSLLEVRLGTQSRTLALRKPVVAEPIVFDLQRASTTVAMALDSMPDPSHLRLHVVKIEGRDGYLLEPAEPISSRTPARLVFPRKTRQGVEVAGVEYRLALIAKRPRVIVELNLVAPRPGQLRPILPPELRKSIEQKVQELAQQVASAKPDPARLHKLSELEMGDAQLWYDDFLRAVHRKAVLHWRVFVEVDGQQLDLIVSQPAPKAPEQKR
jgi:hypothetical protein